MENTGLKYLFRKMAAYGTADVFSGIVRLALSVVYTRFLLPEEFGILAVIYVSVTLFALVAECGLTDTIMAEFRVSDDESNHRLMDQVFLVVSCASVVLLVALNSLAEVLPAAGKYATFRVWVSIWMLSSVLALLPTVLMRFQEKAREYLGIQIVRVVVLLATLFVLFRKGGLDAADIVKAETVSSLAALVLIFPVSRYIPRFHRPANLSGLLLLGFPLLLTALAFFMVDLSDRYLLALGLGAGATGYYAVAARIAVVGSLICEAFFAMWV
ncbi:MAG: oligosaccharide flippase family protein, partial [Bacteroidetes bacterium]|nr:oligosaccharide flippase family protein [Bacteroidota bacterium]